MGKRFILAFIALLFIITPVLSFAQANGSKIKTVVIDAGHGGKDPGNLGTGRYKTTEKHIVLDISLRLGNYIKEAFPDIEVIYTRDKDVFVGLNERAKLANDNKADVFISIHCNAFKNPESHGTESWVMGLHKSEENLKIAQKENSVIFLEDDYEVKYEGFDPNAPESYIAMVIFQNAFLNQSLDLASKVQKQFKTRVGRVDRGVKQAGFVVISKTTMPSILVELGFLTNKEEEDYLNSEDGKVYMASAIFRAFKEYKQEYETPDVVDTNPNPTPEKTEEEKAAEKKEQAEAKKVEEAKRRKEQEDKQKAEEERKKKEEARKKAQADSIAKVEAEKRTKLKADSLAKVEAAKKVKLKEDSIANAKAEKEHLEKVKADSIAQAREDSIKKAKADSLAKIEKEKARLIADSIAKAKEKEREKAHQELEARLKKQEEEKKKKEAELLKAKQRQDSLVKLKAREEALKDSLARMLAEAEMSKQQSLWENVDMLSKKALDSRVDFQKYVDAAIMLDNYLWHQSTKKDKTEAWKARRADKEYQKIYFAFELGNGRNVETFKALTLLYPENSKYIDERAFAMYEEYINDKIKHEAHGGTYELVNYKKLIDASAQALKDELRKEGELKAQRLADSIALVQEKMRLKRDSLKNELQKFREEHEETVEEAPIAEVIREREEDEAFIEKKEELIKKINPPSETISGSKNIVFKIQLASSAKQIPLNSPRFKGVAVNEYMDGNTFKYTAGETASVDEASAMQREMRTKGFNDAFVVAFLNGERIPVSKAREILNNN